MTNEERERQMEEYNDKNLHDLCCEYERQHGSVELLKRGMSAINMALVEKGYCSPKFLQDKMREQLETAAEAKEDPNTSSSSDENPNFFKTSNGYVIRLDDILVITPFDRYAQIYYKNGPPQNTNIYIDNLQDYEDLVSKLEESMNFIK